jgi:hypothetical protein
MMTFTTPESRAVPSEYDPLTDRVAADSVPSTTASAFCYCLLLVLIPLLAIPAFIALGRSNFFLHHGASVWVQANDAVFSMHNRHCDVLVFGDSTAMTGIDPDVVEADTGFRTCNIAVTNAVLAVTNNLTLDYFLAHNGRPRVLLVQLSPDDFEPENRAWNKTIYAEGMLELMRHGRPGDARRLLLSHPQESVSFAGYAAEYTAWYAIKDVWFHVTRLRPEEDTIQVRNGFFTPPSPARTSCTPSQSVVSPTGSRQSEFSKQLVDNYHNDYADRVGLVLVNVAPIPACDQNFAAFAQALDGVTSNALLPLPIGYFNDGRHYTARGSEIVSTLISRELNTVANRNPYLDDRVPLGRPEAALRRVALHRIPARSIAMHSMRLRVRH